MTFPILDGRRCFRTRQLTYGSAIGYPLSTTLRALTLLTSQRKSIGATVAVWSRRVVQGMIDEVAAIMRPTQLRHLVRRLNTAGSEAVEAEYELALLVGLARTGNVTYEQKQPGRTRPDIIFSTAEGEFLCDITCVSQKSLASREPMRILSDTFIRLVEAGALSHEKFHLQVGHTETGEYPNRRVRLSLSSNDRIREVLNRRVPEIARQIKARPHHRSQWRLDESGIDVTVTYDPKGRGFGGGHRVDDLLSSLDQNPVRDALDRKAIQLARSGSTLLKGIFVCDSGAVVLRDTYMAAPFTLRQVIHSFFEYRPEISFVVVLYVPPHGGGLRGGVYSSECSKLKLADVMREILLSLPSRIPKAERDGRNAQTWAEKYPSEGASFFGAYKTMRSGGVKISARALQELLAGKHEIGEWLVRHGFVAEEPNSAERNPFAAALRAGRLIEHVTVERVADEDDDYLTFDFGKVDPAISPFRTPPSIR